MYPVTVILALAWAVGAQTDLPREVLALSRIMRRAKERLGRTANFTCLETTERWSRDSADNPFKLIDTVRVEVAHIGQRDLYSFPGSRSYEDKTPAELVGTGLGSSGSFAGYLRAVLLSGGAVIKFSGDDAVGGRQALRYSYSIPLLFHHTDMEVAGRRGAASIKGAFWAEAENYDVLRLRVEGDEMPPDVPASGFAISVDYGNTRLQDQVEWLPQAAEVLVAYTSGKQDSNHTQFTHCRQYVGESAIRFGEESAPATPQPAKIAEVRLPPGLVIAADLDTEIDSARAVVGDALTATVAADVFAKRRVVIPKGATVHGRLRLLRTGAQPAPHWVVGVEFSEAEFAGTRALFTGTLSEAPRVPGVAVFLAGDAKKGRKEEYHWFSTEALAWETARPPEVPGISTFFMKGTTFRLPKGARLTWRTEKISNPDP